MKYIFTLIVLFIGITAFSQTDSTIITFTYTNDEDLQEMFNGSWHESLFSGCAAIQND